MSFGWSLDHLRYQTDHMYDRIERFKWMFNPIIPILPHIIQKYLRPLHKWGYFFSWYTRIICKLIHASVFKVKNRHFSIFIFTIVLFLPLLLYQLALLHIYQWLIFINQEYVRMWRDWELNSQIIGYITNCFWSHSRDKRAKCMVHPRLLESGHKLVSELLGHCHDSEHLFISSWSDHNGISVALSRAKTKLLFMRHDPSLDH